MPVTKQELVYLDIKVIIIKEAIAKEKKIFGYEIKPRIKYISGITFTTGCLFNYFLYFLYYYENIFMKITLVIIAILNM